MHWRGNAHIKKTHTSHRLSFHLSFCLWGSSVLGLTMQTGCNLFWSRCHIASSNINRLDCTALCLLNNVCWIICAALSHFFFLIHQEKDTKRSAYFLSSCCFYSCVCVSVWEHLCHRGHTHKSIDRALAHWSVCVSVWVSQSTLMPVIWNIPPHFCLFSFPSLSSLPSLCFALSASFSLYLLPAPLPFPPLALCWSRLWNSMLLW